MYFANPWGLLGLVSLPVIAVIHLYHRRFPPLEVAGAHLWGLEQETRSPGRRRERLPVTSTLLLELLAGLLLSLVLAQPRLREGDGAEHLVVVLDNSASMSSRREPGAPALRDAAIAELAGRMEDLPRGSVITVILSGRRPVMLAGPGVPWSEAQPLLEGWRPADTQHEFQSAWDLASQFAEGAGQLLFLTDQTPSEDAAVPMAMEVVSVGLKSENVAIAASRWTFDPRANTGHVYLRIANHGASAANVDVTGRSGEQAVFQQQIAVAPGQEVPLETDVPGGLGELAVEISAPGDGLDVDNRVVLIEPTARVLTVANLLAAEDPARNLVQRVLDGTDSLQPGDPKSAQVVIGPAGELPESRVDLWWLGIGPIDRGEAARKAAKDLIGPYLIEKRNPLLEGVVLGGVIWAGVQPTEGNALPLVSAGESRLLSRLQGTQATAYLLNVDLARSNLTESPDWPILINNLIELRRSNLPGLRQWNYRVDEDIAFRLYEGFGDPSTGGSAGALRLTHGGKSRPLARSNVVEIPPLEEPGVYEIHEGEKLFDRFAVNFIDPEESTLTALRPGVRALRETAQESQLAINRATSWLIMLGTGLILGAVVFDWKVLKPKK